MNGELHDLDILNNREKRLLKTKWEIFTVYLRIQLVNWNYRIFLSFKLCVARSSPAAHSIAFIVKVQGENERKETHKALLGVLECVHHPPSAQPNILLCFFTLLQLLANKISVASFRNLPV